jgi:hypothetical protein
MSYAKHVKHLEMIAGLEREVVEGRIVSTEEVLVTAIEAEGAILRIVNIIPRVCGVAVIDPGSRSNSQIFRVKLEARIETPIAESSIQDRVVADRLAQRRMKSSRTGPGSSRYGSTSVASPRTATPTRLCRTRASTTYSNTARLRPDRLGPLPRPQARPGRRVGRQALRHGLHDHRPDALPKREGPRP